MCGIVGVVSDRPVDAGLVERMRDCLAHRGPDHAGLWCAAEANVCLGHRRLAIIDLSSDANQPFVSPDGRLILTYNGEIYNFRQLRRDLMACGARFHTNSDTEVLIEAYRHWGDQCVARISGMFAFALWDAQEQRLFCARDRAGEKPFYYAKIDGSFVFASEVKALLEWPEFPKNLNFEAMADYLTFGFVPDPKCIWRACRKLAPGHRIAVQLPTDGRPRVGEPRPYWDLEFAPEHGACDWASRIRTTLQAVTEEMAVADVPLGTFLSGGVDSSSVAAALSRAGHAVRTFTIGFDEQTHDERIWARQVAEAHQTSHTERVVRVEDLNQVMQQILWHFDEPFGDYSYLPTFYICQEARRSITVALSGDGGDEAFAGYTKYRRLSLREALERHVPGWLLRFGARGGERLAPAGCWNGRARLRAYGLDRSDLLLDTLTIGQSPDLLRFAARGELARALAHYSPRDTVRAHLAKAPPHKVGLINAMRYLDLKLTLASGILVKVDRASMAHSLEVRPVYVHRDLLDLSARIPPDLLVDRRQAKKLLKSALRGWLPDAVLCRQKQGFALPLRPEMAGSINDQRAHIAGRDPLSDLLDEACVRRALRQDAHAFGNPTFVLHGLFFLRSWLARWVSGAPGAGTSLKEAPGSPGAYRLSAHAYRERASHDGMQRFP